MPVYRIQAPNGKTYRVQADSEQAAIDGLKSQPELQALDKVAQRYAGDRKNAPRQSAASDAFSLGINRLLSPAIAATETAVRNAGTRLKGGQPQYSPGEAFNAVRNAEADAAEEFANRRPVQALASGLLGGLAMPGGKTLANLASPVAKGLLGGVEAIGRGAGIGGGLGAAFGAATARPNDFKGSVARGALAGAVTGGAVPIAAGAATGAASAVGRAGRTVARAANKATGGQLLNPQREAGKRLVESLRADGHDAASIRNIQNDWLKNGVTPTLLDVVGADSKTGALLRGAAMSGAGRRIANQYNQQVVGNLQDRAIGLTERLTPGEARSAQDLSKALDLERAATADRLYPAFKGDEVAVTNIGDALSGDAGASALRSARAIADARRDQAAVAEIDALIGGQSDNVSAGTLDLIRRGIRDAGDAANRNADRTLAGGLTGRANDLETALTEVPGFDAARTAFRDTSQQIDAIDMGATGLRAMPEAFASEFGSLPESARLPAQVGYRQSLTDAIGNPTQGATGLLNRLGTSTNQSRNLATAFGDDAASSYQGGINNLIEQVQNARSINPLNGSRTAVNMADEALVTPSIPTNPLQAVIGLINKVRSGATLTDAEREALVMFGTMDTSAEDLAPQIAERALGARVRQQAPRFAPAIAAGTYGNNR